MRFCGCCKWFDWSKWWLIVKIPLFWPENWAFDPLWWQYLELFPAVSCFILKNHVYTQYQMWFCGCCKWFYWSKWWFIVKIPLSWPENWSFDPLGWQCLDLFPADYCFILKNHVYTQYQKDFLGVINDLRGQNWEYLSNCSYIGLKIGYLAPRGDNI